MAPFVVWTDLSSHNCLSNPSRCLHEPQAQLPAPPGTSVSQPFEAYTNQNKLPDRPCQFPQSSCAFYFRDLGIRGLNIDRKKVGLPLQGHPQKGTPQFIQTVITLHQPPPCMVTCWAAVKGIELSYQTADTICHSLSVYLYSSW